MGTSTETSKLLLLYFLINMYTVFMSVLFVPPHHIIPYNKIELHNDIHTTYLFYKYLNAYTILIDLQLQLLHLCIIKLYPSVSDL